MRVARHCRAMRNAAVGRISGAAPDDGDAGPQKTNGTDAAAIVCS